ncbi:MAG: LPS assembly protein LptD, partial [Cucumibacter sp.]
GLAIPYYWALDPDYNVTFSPTLFFRQGLMGDVAWQREIGNLVYDVHGWAIYQLDPSAYVGEVGDRAWRGATQSTGEYTPNEHWRAGWSATAFTDPGFLPDYGVGKSDHGFAVNEAYATYLDADLYKDVRIQQFLDLGDTSPAEQAEQGAALPRGRYEQIVRLDGDRGEVRLGAGLDNVYRGGDQIEYVGPGLFPHVFGFEEHKVHASLEAGWTNQYATAGGLLFAPYLGLRADAANYDGASGDPLAPPAGSLFSATPIAALDVRWPLIGRGEGVTHFVEPIVQIVARGGGATTPGITNDDAQSFVFEDTNLFSFNRFSGIDRQETGVRAAWGLHYNAQFDAGGWLDLIAGQSFQIAGANSFAAPDPALPGPGSGLEEGALSHFVAGATGSPGGGLSFGAKALVDPSPLALSRAAVAARLESRVADVTFDYSYIAPVPGIGIDDARHEVGASAKLPISDYWSATAGGHYDLGAMSFARADVGVDYDDGYLAYGIGATAYGPTSATSPDSLSIDFYIKLMPITGFGGGLEFD